MISVPVEPRGWSTRRWSIAIALVFGLQVALVFWLEDRTPVAPRKRGAAPAYRFGNGPMADGFALEDPTLFVLPHREGFSGEAWLTAPSVVFRPTDWSEPARFLPPELEHLGSRFRTLVATSAPPSFSGIVELEPELTVPRHFSIAPPTAPSRLSMEGDLAKRRLLSALDLTSWTHTDLLTNSVVQLLVNGRGIPLSTVLLARSGSTNADQCALELARAARFEPAGAGDAPGVTNPSAGLSIGTMVFEWQTLPSAATNAPPITP